MEEKKQEIKMQENNNQETKNKKNKDVTLILEKTGKGINIILKTILNFVYIILAVIVIILIYNIIQLSILNKPYMNLFGYSFFEVKTGSMSGTMEIGDIIIVKITNDVKKDDIVTYEEEQSLITHRIIDIKENTITTKGDANNTQDEPIEKERVIGKVVHIFKNIEIWKNVFKSPQVYLPVIATLILFGITISIGEKKKE